MLMTHLAAWRDFLRRYAQAFRAVWSIRAQLDPPPRSDDELAFLPAHLELVETPVSAKPRWAMRLIIALAACVLAWACWGQLDIVAVASGRIIPSGRSKVVQPLEAGVINAIHVRDGQEVKRGDLLIELDGAATGASAAQAQDAVQAARAAIARHQALLDAVDAGRAPDSLTWDAATATQADTESRLARSEYVAYVAQLDALSNQLAQREAEQATLDRLLPHLKRASEVAKARADDLRALLAKNFVSRHDMLAAEQAEIAAQREWEEQNSRKSELAAAIAAQREQVASLRAEFRRQHLDGLREAQERMAQLDQEAEKSTHRHAQTRLVAPVDGVVQQLAVHTVGGVVTPAQPLLVVVPSDDVLEVEAEVLNRDIGFVREGQDVVVKIESFPYTRYGMLTGRVVHVSHDAQQHEQLGLVFQARVQLEHNQIEVEGMPIRLSPGMTLSVEIKTGKRRVIDYLLSPLKQYSGEAMRER